MIERRATWGYFVGLGLFLAGGPATAAQPLADRPATWDMTRAQLSEIGLGQSRGEPIPVPPQAQRLNTEPDVQANGFAGTIFVNFDGAMLSGGWDDAKSNITQIQELQGNFAAYGEGAKRAATMQAVREDWADFNVLIVEERPAEGEYTMNMTGPTNPFGGNVLGIAPLDCADQQTHSNITYAFHSANDQYSASTQATTIGQEVAHSYGLEHVNDPGDVMNPFNAGGNPSFRDECISIVGGSVLCGAQHDAECGSAVMQNSHAELLTMFGPSIPDAAAPTVSIDSPTDGAQFETDADFVVSITAEDDQAIAAVTLFVDGEDQGTKTAAPYGFEFTQTPSGTYELYAQATDLAGNEAMSDVITIYVGQDAPPDDGSDDDDSPGGDDDPSAPGNDDDDDDSEPNDGPDDDGSGGGGGGGADGEDPPLPPDFGGRLDGAETGCACNSNTPPSLWMGLFALFAFAGARRRRPC